MAGFLAILRALGRAFWRDLRTLNSLTANNFFLFAIVLLLQPSSATFLLLVLGLLLLFPLSADPMRKIPPDRLGLWPLSRRKRVGLRLASLVLSPVVWITVALLLKAAQPVLGLRFLLFAVLVQGLSIAATRLAVRIPRGNLLRDLPRLPGTLGSLVQKDLRQMLSVLDPYIALLLCLAASLYRLSGRPLDPEALPVLSLLVALALSTYSQCLFGLDLASGLARYRLLPLRGWQILLAKDAAFLLVLFLLVLPLAPLPGIAGGLVALAIGHHTSVRLPMPQHRWRFTGGVLFPTGAVQVAAMMSTGIAAARQSPLYAAAALAFYLGSVWYCGRLWDRGESA